MSFYIRFDDIQAVNAYANERLSDVREVVGLVNQGIGTLVTSPGFEGAAGDKARSYLSEVHGLLFRSFETAIAEYLQLFLMYKDGYFAEVDTHLHAEFGSDELANAISSLKNDLMELGEESDKLDSAVESVADLLTYCGPTEGPIIEAGFNTASAYIAETQDKVGEFEAAHSADLEPVNQQIALIKSIIDQYFGSHGSMVTQYDPGALGKSPAGTAISLLNTELANRQQARLPDIGDMLLREQERINQLMFEQGAAGQRIQSGWMKVLTGGLFVVGGVIVVATGGAALPLFAAGVGIVIGISEIDEGIQLISYGSRGDSTTPTMNFIRDLVFGSNEHAYGQFQFVVSAMMGAGIPAGVPKWIAASLMAKSLIKEGAQDYAVQKTSEQVTINLGGGAGMAVGIFGGAAFSKLDVGKLIAPKTFPVAPVNGGVDESILYNGPQSTRQFSGDSVAGARSNSIPVTRKEFDDFVASLEALGAQGVRRANYGTTTGAREYQRSITGDHEFHLMTRSYFDRPGDLNIWADGLRYNPLTGGVAVEVKYVERPGKSSLHEGSAPPFLMDSFRGEFEYSMRKYAAVIAEKSTPVTEVEVVTSTDSAVRFLSGEMKRIAESIKLETGQDLKYTVRKKP